MTCQNRTSLVAQMVKHLSTMRETRVRSLGQEDLLEKEMAIHSSTIAWKIPWTEEFGRLQSMGSQRVRHDWATSLTQTLNNWGRHWGKKIQIGFWDMTENSGLGREYEIFREIWDAKDISLQRDHSLKGLGSSDLCVTSTSKSAGKHQTGPGLLLVILESGGNSVHGGEECKVKQRGPTSSRTDGPLDISSPHPTTETPQSVMAPASPLPPKFHTSFSFGHISPGQ